MAATVYEVDREHCAVAEGIGLNDRPLIISPGVAGVVLTCEHASHAVPESLGGLGLDEEVRRQHIGWDIGAAALSTALAERLSAPAVLSAVSRLIVDCNRGPSEPDLIPEESHGVAIPANRALDPVQRHARLRRYYQPFHDAVDDVLAAAPAAKLLSVHSFTPDYDGRDFDVGVLFDDHDCEAQRLAADLDATGFAVRMNQPYSGLDGLIFSARAHGRRFGRTYLEVEVNNRLLRDEAGIARVARGLAKAVARFAAKP